ncbi:MAG: amino acid racemase [Sciscionella sp.]|nr:amino acid racemase [Sciscionella sp.]
MRRIGLLGGMSWESTAVYYRLLNEGTKRRHGGLASADLVLRSVNFAEIERLQAAGAWDQLGERLGIEAKALVAAGAELIGIATNTMHLVAPRVEAAGVPVVHIVDVVADAALAKRYDTIALLGTDYLMTAPLYPKRLAAQGIDVIIPDADDRATVHRVIYDELCRGVVSAESRRRYVDVIARLAERGAKAVVLGCTEIGLLIGAADVDVPLLDSTTLHVDALLLAAEREGTINE